MIDIDDVRSAAAALDGVAHRTPVLSSRTLDAATGATVFCKAECYQRGGAFKFRGAYSMISRVPSPERARGVAAYSSGNHAQAVAIAAAMLDAPAVILMPEDAPAAKLDATRGYGAEVVSYDRYSQDRDQLGRVEGGVLAVRDHYRHRVAHVASHVGAQGHVGDHDEVLDDARDVLVLAEIPSAGQ
jgi:threonine dehydratase